ncbi:MAG: hypothetical protein KF819_15975 [Labilithrix sp.]|nr:hypothetical protein [Labilithrix sp.]
MRRLFGVVLVMLGLAASSTARADAPPPGRAAIGEELHGYYVAERNTAFLFMGIGAASAGAGAVLATRDGDFARGLGWSLVAVGGLELLGAAFYAFQVDAEIDHYTGVLAKDPDAYKREESAHIHGTTSRFLYYRIGELVLAVAGTGLAIYGFAADEDVYKGVGLGIAVSALTFFILDGFGQSRAKRYEERVNRFDPSVAFSPGVGDRPWALTVGGRF